MPPTPRPLLACVLGLAVATAVGQEPAEPIRGGPLISVTTWDELGGFEAGWSALAGRDGVLHFGGDGLASFDGDLWTTDSGGRGYAFRGLDEGPDGRIWAAGTNEIGWFSPPGRGGRVYHSLVGSLPPSERLVGEMWAACVCGDGALFAGTHDVYVWDGHRMHVFPLPGGRRLAAFRVGTDVYVDHPPGGLLRYRNGRLESFVPGRLLGTAVVVWLRKEAGGWLLATTGGLKRWRDGRLEPAGRSGSTFLSRNALTAATGLPDGRIAAATLRGGVVLLRPDGAVDAVIDARVGLPSDEIFALTLDADGGLWAASPGGLFRISLTPALRVFRFPPGAEPFASVVGAGSRIVLGGGGGLFALDSERGELQPFAAFQPHCWALAPYGAGILVARSHGCDLVEDGRSRELFHGPWDVFAVCPAGPGPDAVVFTADRSVMRWSAATGSISVVASRLPDVGASLAVARDGTIWVGTPTAGLLEVDGGRLGAPEGIAGNAGPARVIGRDGAVFAFVGERGWARPAGGGAFGAIEGFPRRSVAACGAASGSAACWVAHPAEDGLGTSLGRIGWDGRAARWEGFAPEGLWVVGEPLGLHVEDLPGASEIWVAGTAGVVACQVGAGMRIGPPEPPTLDVYRRDGVAAVPLDDGAVPYATGEILVRGSVRSYGLRPELTGEIRVDGLDSDWQPFDAGHPRRLAALRDGSYRIRVRTVAATGAIGPELARSFTVLAPWWRTPASMMLFAGGLVATAAALHRLRLRSLRKWTRELEGAVRRRTAEVERANAARTEFVAAISHDIRNPLNGIVGLTFALEDTALDEQQRRFTAAMRGCAQYLNGIMDGVVDLARVEAGGAPLTPEAFEPRAVLREVAAMAEAEARAAGAEILVTVDPSVPARLVADARRLRQILGNFVFNAVKYAPGPIELAAARRSASEVEFSVRDRGPGFDEDARRLLFTPFRRLGSPAGASPPGAGLGLAASRRWAESMGGTVGVESRPGAGARFWLRLPLVAAPDESPELAAAFERPARILLVEDEEYNTWAVTGVLSRVGLGLSARARTLAEARGLLEAGGFDLVLLDRNLPDGDGLDLIGAIQASGNGRPARVIVLSAYVTEEDRRRCLAAGADGFLGKPLTPDKLREALARPFAPAAAAGFDTSLIAYLSDGSAQAFERELERYLDVLDADSAALQRAVGEGDRPAVSRLAHRLMGHFSVVNAAEMAEAAGRLELAAGEPAGRLDALAAQLRANVEALNAALRRLTG